MPNGLADRVLVALAADDLDLEYELLTLVHRSNQLAGARTSDDCKLVLEFTGPAVSVLVRVSPAATTGRRIDGWVTQSGSALGGKPLTATLWQESGTLTCPVAAHGRFEFAAVPAGLTRLDVVGERPEEAFRTTLFEI